MAISCFLMSSLQTALHRRSKWLVSGTQPPPSTLCWARSEPLRHAKRHNLQGNIDNLRGQGRGVPRARRAE